MIKKYRVFKSWGESFDFEIEEVDVFRETEKCVFCFSWLSKAGRELKHPKFGRQYFDTKKEAVNFLKGEAEARLILANAQKSILPRKFKELEVAADRKICHAIKIINQVKDLYKLAS